MGCPACSQPVPDGARFCPSCGTALTHQLVRELVTDEERRVVTVLFADLVSFTSLAQHRDPEQVKRLVDAAFAKLVADVEAHGGVVDKLLGDAIVALFGAPVAHEDDADRAVRAGLAMQATLRDFREEHPDDNLRMRIGVNTGEVLVGTLAGTDYTAMGDVVNTAARLQQLAPPGAVLVGDATHALCSPTLRFRLFDEVQLRGRDESAQIWQAVAHDSALFARRWQSDVEFVGRTTEFGVVRNLASIALAGRSAIVSVTGEPGIGKSRLVHEVIGTILAAEPDTYLVEGVCAPYGESNPWWPLAGGLLARLGLDRSCPADEARRRVIRRLEPFHEFAPGSPEFNHVVEVVMHLLGHPSALDELGPAAARDAVFAGLTVGIERRAGKSPVVVWIDDLQWAAPGLLDLLEAIARRLSALPVLILTTYRRSDDGLSDWPGSVDPALTLHLPLAPLPDNEAIALVHTSADRPLPDKTVQTISARCRWQPAVHHRAGAAGGSRPRRTAHTRSARLVASVDLGSHRSADALAASGARQRRDRRCRGSRGLVARVRRGTRAVVRRRRDRRARLARAARARRTALALPQRCRARGGVHARSPNRPARNVMPASPDISPASARRSSNVAPITSRPPPSWWPRSARRRVCRPTPPPRRPSC